MLTEISQTQKEKYCMILLICGIYMSHLYMESKKVKYIEAENRTVLTRVEEVGKWGDVSQRIQSCSYVG